LKSKNLVLGLLIFVCLSASAYFFFRGDSTGQKKRRDLAGELAAWVAKEAAGGGRGKTLILAPVETPRDPFPGQLAKRLETNLRAAGFDPVEVERVPYNTALESSGEPVTRDAFLSLLKAHADAAVVVSLVGIPRLTEADLPAQNRPRIIVASTVIMPHLESLPPGLIDFAIEVKQDVNDPRTDPSLGELSHYFVLRRFR
jgi:hypothetical protein